ncbi:hypothetical protein SASC598O11_014400 [Snodgrassella alvi SCGC AB-598-O11]|nr:hypothetical protein SASC598O11_014400 [Snodgrassella alvi SCGC AB-598-O11]
MDFFLSISEVIDRYFVIMCWLVAIFTLFTTGGYASIFKCWCGLFAVSANGYG